MSWLHEFQLFVKMHLNNQAFIKEEKNIIGVSFDVIKKIYSLEKKNTFIPLKEIVFDF